MENMSRYFGMVKCIDDNVGKILAALRAAGVAERTIVMFTSDHGDMCGEHGRVNKGIPLEGSARIPFLISYPGKIKPGTVIHEALNNVDFKPTILALMGAAARRRRRRPRRLRPVSHRPGAGGLEEHDLLPECQRQLADGRDQPLQVHRLQ